MKISDTLALLDEEIREKKLKGEDIEQSFEQMKYYTETQEKIEKKLALFEA